MQTIQGNTRIPTQSILLTSNYSKSVYSILNKRFLSDTHTRLQNQDHYVNPQISVSSGSGASIGVRVRVAIEPLPDWRSGLSIDPNCRFGYGSIDISLPV